MQHVIHKTCKQRCFRLICSLDTTISRTITINVPLIPAYTGLRTLLYEITENGYELITNRVKSRVKNFLIRKNKYIELITSQSVFEYVANAYDPDDTIMDNIRRQRIPFKPRTMTIRDAFNFMIEKVKSEELYNFFRIFLLS